MPLRDKTGPGGAGPKTGMGAGGCSPEEDEVEKSLAIKKLYRDAGFTPPKGKGIHTEKFHRCVVDVKKKIRDGKMGEGSDPYAICMNSLGAAGAVKPEHQRSKVAKALVADSMTVRGRRSVRQSRIDMLLAGLAERMKTLRDERDYYIAEIYGYADAMKRGDWQNKYALKLIEHANELATILDEMATNEARQTELRAELQLQSLRDKVSPPTIGEVEAKEGP